MKIMPPKEINLQYITIKRIHFFKRKRKGLVIKRRGYKKVNLGKYELLKYKT